MRHPPEVEAALSALVSLTKRVSPLIRIGLARPGKRVATPFSSDRSVAAPPENRNTMKSWLARSQGTWGALDAAGALLADEEGETHTAGWTVATVDHMAYHGC